MRPAPRPKSWRVRRALHYRGKDGRESYVAVGEIATQLTKEELSPAERAALADRWLVEQASDRHVEPIAVMIGDSLRYVIPGDHVDVDPIADTPHKE